MKKDFRWFRADVSAIALFGALGFVSGASEAAIIGCTGTTAEERTSAVQDDVTGSGSGFRYRYLVCNTSDSYNQPISLLRDWELPFDGVGDGQNITSNAAGISNIVTPEGWDWAIERRGVSNGFTGWDGQITWQNPTDPFYNPVYANHEYVLHFYTRCFEGEGCFFGIGEGGSKDNFGFDSPIGPAPAPYQASWFEQPPRTGDPAFPLQGGIPATFQVLQAVPEPGSLGLLAGGLGALLLAAGRRRSRRDEQES
ncbi:MAG: PEP-CTERM sorting domain-containing protein [Burkholderiales bacterium]|nr:PEP-CTERM sorting domain-containing protein [Burkholderiales bacterium]